MSKKAVIFGTCFTYTACCIILLHNFLHGDIGETGDIANIANIAGAFFLDSTILFFSCLFSNL